MRYFVLALLLFASTTALAKEVSHTFSVVGWQCPGCAQKSVKALMEIKGIKSATPDLDKKQLAVTFDDAQTSPAVIQAAIKKMKFGCQDD